MPIKVAEGHQSLYGCPAMSTCSFWNGRDGFPSRSYNSPRMRLLSCRPILSASHKRCSVYYGRNAAYVSKTLDINWQTAPVVTISYNTKTAICIMTA